MNVLLLTTCDMLSARLADLERLTRSLAVNAGLATHQITQLLLLQRAQPEDLASHAKRRLPFQRVCLSVPGRVSLAAARNIMLRLAHQRGLLQAADWVAFPDDDAWYPAGLVDEVCGVFARHREVDLATCQYGRLPVAAIGGLHFVPQAEIGPMVRVMSSNTLFVRRAAIEAAGVYFDERLGLGAAINGGEDLDFALRVLSFGGGVAYDPLCRVGHRERQAWVRSRYFDGSLCALTRAASASWRMRPTLWRKWLVGAALMVRGEMSPTQLVNAWRLSRPFRRLPRHVQVSADVRPQASEVAPLSARRAGWSPLR